MVSHVWRASVPTVEITMLGNTIINLFPHYRISDRRSLLGVAIINNNNRQTGAPVTEFHVVACVKEIEDEDIKTLPSFVNEEEDSCVT